MTGPPRHVAALLDLHVHSQYSSDAQGTLEDLAQRARDKGIQGFAITDHNRFTTQAEIKKAKLKELLIIPGIEVSTRHGHCLAIGVQEAIPARLPLEETLERIRDAGGVGVPSHPYRTINGVGEVALWEARRRVSAIEVYNARDGESFKNRSAHGYATDHRLGGTGGSDTHRVHEVGNAYTMFPEFPNSVDDVVSMIRRRRTWGSGTATSRSHIFSQQIRTFRLWARRGFRSM